MPYIPFRIIKEFAKQEGFCQSGATKVSSVEGNFLHTWLKKGMQASMSYMENYADKRQNPSLLVDNSKSIICFLYSYNDERIDKDSPIKIAHYAQRKDYHYTLKEKLYNIITKIRENYTDFQARAFVDSAPVLERSWAHKCGLGWIGRSSLLINKDYGSKVFICEIVCNYTTDYNTKEVKNLCGNCNLCLRSCPNNAIGQNNFFDANKCISYQTIENKNDIPSDFDTGGYIYGCDICLEICPWNIRAKKVCNLDLDTKKVLTTVIEKIHQGTLQKKDFKLLGKLSPINRVKYEKFLNNIAHCKTNLK